MITPFQALCLAERCALLSGRDIDFVMNVFAAWTGVRWGELLAVEGWAGKDSPLQIPKTGIATYAVDWQLRELGGAVRKSAPKDGSYRVLDLPPFLAEPHAVGDGQPPRHLLLPAQRRPAGLQGRRPDPGRTTCSSAPRAATRAGPTTPTASSPRPPKASTQPATAPAARLRHRRALARHPDPQGQPENTRPPT